MPDYLMEAADEAARLELKTQVDETRAHLTLVGLRPGMRALDAGAGTGAVAREMAAMVGEAGSVVAFDQSQERLDEGRKLSPAKNLEFVKGDLYAPPLEPGSFDFIWCRFIFEYLSDPDAALAQFKRLLKPGGKVVVGDLDGNTIWHYPEPPEVAEGLPKIMRAIEGQFDPHAGRKLFHRFRRAGLEQLRVHLLPYHLFAGEASARDMSNWEAKIRNLRGPGEKTLGREGWERFGRAYLEMLRAPDSLTYSVLFFVEGVRPRE